MRKNLVGVVISDNTTYTIGFSTTNKSIEFEPDGSQFNEITGRMWKTIGINILMNSLYKLRDGEILTFGNAKISDSGIELEKHNYFSANERKFFGWKDISIYSENGNFTIQEKSGANDYKVHLSYLNDDNTHVLEAMIRKLFKKFNRNNPRMSSLLNG